MATIRLGAAPFGTGVRFVTPAGDVPANLVHARPLPGATTLVAGNAVVGTPEHLMAALRGLGLTDVRVELDGAELPALDGAAAAWATLLAGAGRSEGPALAPVVGAGRVAVAGGEVELLPLRRGERPTVTVEVDFPDGPHGSAHWDGTAEGFRRDVAWARTFVMEDEVEPLRAAGRGKGATAENTRVVPRVRSAEGLAREAVVHKLLDAIGDVALVPGLAAHVVVRRGSHRVHVEGLRALLP